MVLSVQLSPQNIANPSWQFWGAGVGYVGQHGVARGEEPAAAMDSRASMAAAAATAAPGFAAAAVPVPTSLSAAPSVSPQPSWTDKKSN